MSLKRFHDAQADAHRGYDTALDEIRAGRKRNHWIWYVFPQLRGLGHSEQSRRYAITDAAEARAYFFDPVLGPRLAEISEALAALDLPLGRVLDAVDARKVVSSLTLFDEISAEFGDDEVAWCSGFARAAQKILAMTKRLGVGRCQFTLESLRRDGACQRE